MNNIQFSVLSYYPSIINDENINVGLLFYNADTKQRMFYTTENLKRLQSFDDELDVKFMMTYLCGIKEEWEASLFGMGNECSVESFIYNYGNELRFGKIQNAIVDNPDSFFEETKKMYFRFDYDLSSRPSEESIRKYIKTLLKANSIKYSSKRIPGRFEEEINYDFVVGSYGFKSFVIDENSDVQRQYMIYKGWSYTAQLNEELRGLKTIFVIDSERTDENFIRAKTMLEFNARIIKPSEVIPFIKGIA